MSTTSIELFEAQQRLAAVQERQREEERERQVEKLKGVRVELRTQRAELAKLEKALQIETEQRGRIQAALDSVLLALDESWPQRPLVASVLPDDPEVQEWHRAHTMLERQRDELLRERDSIPRTDRLQGVRLADSITRLEFAERNLINVLNGSLGIPRGGIETVR